MDSRRVTLNAPGADALEQLQILRTLAIGQSPTVSDLEQYKTALNALIQRDLPDLGAEQADLELIVDSADAPELVEHAWDLCGVGLPATQASPLCSFTRLVQPEAPTKMPEAPTDPLCVLFVVPRGIDGARVRPATEYLGLLRVAREGDRRLKVVPILQATREMIAEAMELHRPAVVHVVAHGQPGGLIGLGSADGELPVDAASLAVTLNVGPSGPWLVVLNACHSADAYGTMEPLAAGLVREGVPAVVAMGEAVVDRAARAFAWSFYKALLGRAPLPMAVAQGRRAIIAAGFPPASSIEWARPALFRREDAPLVVREDKAWERLSEAVSRCRDKMEEPATLGDRVGYLDQPYRWLLEPRRTRILLLFTSVNDADRNRLGRSRLLHELTAALTLDGHLVVLLEQPSRKPGRDVNAQTLVTALEEAITTTRWRHGLRRDGQTRLALRLMQRLDPAAPPPEGIPGEVLDAWERADKRRDDVEVLKAAVCHDLYTLLEDARAAGVARPGGDARPPSRLFLFVDELNEWAIEAARLVALITDPQIWRDEDPVRFAVTIRQMKGLGGQQAGIDAEKTLKDRAPTGSLRSVEVAPLTDFEARLAMTHWLLGRYDQSQPAPLWWSDVLTEPLREASLVELLRALNREPGNHPEVFKLIEMLHRMKLLVPAPEMTQIEGNSGNQNA